jgi:hypothetical protein
VVDADPQFGQAQLGLVAADITDRKTRGRRNSGDGLDSILIFSVYHVTIQTLLHFDVPEPEALLEEFRGIDGGRCLGVAHDPRKAVNAGPREGDPAEVQVMQERPGFRIKHALAGMAVINGIPAVHAEKGAERQKRARLQQDQISRRAMANLEFPVVNFDRCEEFCDAFAKPQRGLLVGGAEQVMDVLVEDEVPGAFAGVGGRHGDEGPVRVGKIIRADQARRVRAGRPIRPKVIEFPKQEHGHVQPRTFGDLEPLEKDASDEFEIPERGA